MIHSTVLDRIVEFTKRELEKKKKKISLKAIMRQAEMAGNQRPFLEAISVSGEVSIIAEMKQKSPSAGMLQKNYSPSHVAERYAHCGARALSVLTEKKYFGGKLKDMIKARERTSLPVLRKDFIIEPYQVFESKVAGASAILLIMAILDQKLYSELLRCAYRLRLDALVEVHNEKELKSALREKPKIIGINNRNLKTLSTDIGTTFKLIKKIPGHICVVSESGIKEPQTIRELKSAGVRAVLIGESLLRSRNMGEKLKSFVEAGQ